MFCALAPFSIKRLKNSIKERKESLSAMIASCKDFMHFP